MIGFCRIGIERNKTSAIVYSRYTSLGWRDCGGPQLTKRYGPLLHGYWYQHETVTLQNLANKTPKKRNHLALVVKKYFSRKCAKGKEPLATR